MTKKIGVNLIKIIGIFLAFNIPVTIFSSVSNFYLKIIIAATFIVLLFQIIIGSIFKVSGDAPMIVSNNFDVLSLFILSIILAPLTEEIAFRAAFRYYFNFLKSDFLLTVFSALFFSLAHIPKDIPSFIVYFFMGAILMCSYNKTDNILNPLLIHSMCNIYAATLYIFF